MFTKTVAVTLLIFIGSFISQPANALGDKEQGVLMGIAALKIFQDMKEQERISQKVNDRYSGYSTYNEYRDAEIREAYMRGLEERRRRELEAAKQEAYQCALEGTC